MVTPATQRPLVAFAPADLESRHRPRHRGADDQRRRQDDDLQDPLGLKYSPPVDREVTAADVKYAIERGLLPGEPNGYAQTYLPARGHRRGAQAAPANPTVGAPDISGITAPDETTLVFKLKNRARSA